MEGRAQKKSPSEVSSPSEGIAEELGISLGFEIAGNKGKYVVQQLLGEGGFGAVFKVYDKASSSKIYAVKVEKRDRKHSKLRMEIAILKDIKTRAEKNKEDNKRIEHFTKIVDRGKKDIFVFLVMELVGKSLSDLKDETSRSVFSLGTGLGASKQCLEAIQDLHGCGFIHRDIKPSNFAIGLGSNSHIIYILDFGIARKLTNKLGEMKTPRQFVNFKGTIRFAALACHHNQELGYKDDVESWFYLLLDLIVASGLPWKDIEKKDVVAEKKMECHTNSRSLLMPKIVCSDILFKILDYVDTLVYQNRVDYEFIYDCLEKAADVCDVSTKPPYDWMPKNKHTRRSK